MDDYPEELAPEFEDSGAVKTPFDIWWPQVNHHFENVPENVAKHWLHRHWSHSPYSWLRSKNYKFNLTNWESKELGKIWSRWYKIDIEECVKHGEGLVNKLDFWLKNYMVEHHDYPEPIIVLDNRDNHLDVDAPNHNFPASYLLIEGHLRFNISLYLQRTDRFTQNTKIWLMKRI